MSELTQVAVVSGICVKHDAISSSIRDDVSILKAQGHLVRFFGYACEYPDLAFQRVGSLRDLLVDPFYRKADLIIFHFGVFYELFNAVAVGNAKAKVAVRYHNVTPAKFLAKEAQDITEKSLSQQFGTLLADVVWPVSVQNALDLAELGVEESRIKIVPLVASDGSGMRNKESGSSVEALFVGRCVPSKGLVDLIRAVDEHIKSGLIRRLRIIGGSRFADLHYKHRVLEEIRLRRIESSIELISDAPLSALNAAYDSADIFIMPSYHEGFCIPVIEALSRGVVPITYDSYNLKYISEGLSRVVQAGSIEDLTRCIGNVARELVLAKTNDAAKISLDVGGVTLAEFRAAARRIVGQYTRDAVASSLLKRVSELLV